MGKQGQKLKDLEKSTATKISVPKQDVNSDVIVITGTKEGIENAEHHLRVTSDELVFFINSRTYLSTYIFDIC